ncbi:Hypothetical protein LUCI_2847 [Lucifera butyrica]|uniref:Uncharacterized protein n=1 Tax=Lucifera butyrica TaxID=1351585 RepID=A0A498RBD5_9FIRM|nr:hypothetical protein [Lucifera butyrica]VBB07582.1 Hypothetical protein LUCI_2847 [Lucifera butyrica]
MNVRMAICLICGENKPCIINMEEEATYEIAICPECLGIELEE